MDGTKTERPLRPKKLNGLEGFLDLAEENGVEALVIDYIDAEPPMGFH